MNTGWTIPGDLPPEVHEHVVELVRRLDIITTQDPLAAEAVRIAAKVRTLIAPLRSRGYKHGLSGYTAHGCRCPVCTEAHSKYRRAYRDRNPEKFERGNRERRERRKREREASTA